MPNGTEFVTRPDFRDVDITVKDYLDLYLNWINWMVDAGVLSEETAEGYNQRTVSLLRAAIPPPMTLEQVLAEEPPEKTFTHPWHKISPIREEIPVTPFTLQAFNVPVGVLPFYEQVVAPVAYRNMGAQRATKYGYEPGSSQYKSEIIKAIKEGEEFQQQFAANILGARQEAPIEAEAALREVSKAEMSNWLLWQGAAQRQAQAMGERATLEAQQRKESWAREAALRERPGEYEPRIPTGERVVREFIEEERPGAIQKFIRGRLPGVLAKFQREMGGARRAWWRELQRPDYEEKLEEAEYEAERWQAIRGKGLAKGMERELSKRAAELGRPLTQTDLTPEEYYFTLAGKRMLPSIQEVERLRGRVGERRERPTGEDPLKSYLAQYPWIAEFYKLSPAQRGFRPSLYAPSARWFT